MSWFASWLPAIPTINLSIPTSIQSRFVSFFLKKSLGHFFKPGQLDTPQIDSQIGSGYVQINDLELDPTTINSYLSGLPLVLEEGVVKAVTARIPWPNPLTSTIGFSLNSLHITLRLQAPLQRLSDPDVDLASSVASVAETFVQEELADPEEARLWESFHDTVLTQEGDDHTIPGGLETFAQTGPAGSDIHEVDPVGVSMFATLIERLLARFQFDAQDIQVTIIDPNNITLKLSLSEVHYSSKEGVGEPGTRRTVSLSGIQVATVGHIATASPTKSQASTTRPESPSSVETVSRAASPPHSSPSSSTSSLDEDTQFNMSQSLAGLPPRPLHESTTSSIYHSIISERDTDPRGSHSSTSLHIVPCEASSDAAKEHTLLSLGTMPLEFNLTTPSPTLSGPTSQRGDRYSLDISCGSIAIALQPWQISCLLQTIDTMNSFNHPTRKTNKETTESLVALDVDLRLRSLTMLLLPSQPLDSVLTEPVQTFFARPLTPPQLGVGYSRLFVDGIAGQAYMRASDLDFSLTIGDISAFQFFGLNSRGTSQHSQHSQQPIAIPILITDPSLSSQYSSHHTYPSRTDPFQTSVEQPTMQIVDWLDKSSYGYGSRISQWRTRKQVGEKNRRTGKTAKDDSMDDDSKPRQHAVQLRYQTFGAKSRRTRQSQPPTVIVEVAALHLFVDLEMSLAEGGLAWFGDQIAAAASNRSENDRGYLSDEDEPLYSQESYRTEASLPTIKDAKASSTVSLSWTIQVAMIRVSARVPPPPERARRSGILVLDVHDINVSDKQPSRDRHLRFSVPSLRDSKFVSRGAQETLEQLAYLQCQQIVLGCSTIGEDHTVAFLSVGPLQPSTDQAASLSPRISISNAEANSIEQPLSVSIDIPSVYVSLSKKQLDALHYWIDDVSQTFERINARNAESPSHQGSKDASLLGSRYFSKSRIGSSGFNSQGSADAVKTYVALNITEVYIRVHLPRSDDGVPVRPFDVACSDLSANVKLHAAGKIEAIVGVMDAFIQDSAVTEAFRTFLSLTASRSLTAMPLPLLKLKFISSPIPGSAAKENRVSLSLNGFTLNLYPDLHWVADLVTFAKSPPGTFESVVPTERTLISLKITDGSVRAMPPSHPGAVVLAIGGLNFVTDIIGGLPDTSFRVDVASLSALIIENLADANLPRRKAETITKHWQGMGYALLADVSSLKLKYQENRSWTPAKEIIIDGLCLKVHACADTLDVVGALVGDLSSLAKSPEAEGHPPPTMADRGPTVLSRAKDDGGILTGSIDDGAFRRVPDVGSAPDMIYDDLPTNLDYLDESFGAAAGLRELTDDDLDEFDTEDIENPAVQISTSNTGIISSVGGETIKLLVEEGINIIENYYDTLPRETVEDRPNTSDEAIRIRIHSCDVYLLLYDGFDWPKTRKVIEDEVKEMRKRLSKIRQLVANGVKQEAMSEDTSAVLFNSIYIGLDQDVDTAEPDALIAAIDEELKEDFETGTQSSWQSLKHPKANQPRAPSVRVHGKKLTRSRAPSMEFCLMGVNAEFNQYGGEGVMVSRTFVTVKDLEILDHIKTSTWKKFLTALRADSKGNIRETGANMVRVELHNVRPAPGHPSQEARMRAKILPIRLYVDQDAVDFLKKFFSFKAPDAAPPPEGDTSEGDAYIQLAEVFPIDLKLDYKPRRVDYRALKEGKTIELMNFFHFDGAEMTLRHIKLSGIMGWPKVFEMLNDLWTPDVKATQLVDVISGVAPIRSVVNVGSGVADLVLLPIAQYKKDGRIVRGVQKGATAFVKSTAIEAIKMGARLATGTQVILEQAEGLLGGEFDRTITTETVPTQFEDDFEGMLDDEAELISKYAQQPSDIKEGVQSAYKSLQKNLSSAAQTILAVPMEVYERSGNEGPVRSVIRAVPIAVLKPMIGASEAVSKTLLGLHNTLDPNVRHENEAKYK